jgi:transcriptional enhancer factor
MEYSRHIQPSSYPSHHISLDDLSGPSRTREVLSDTAGNVQSYALEYHDSKGIQPLERPMYSIPTLPSQSARHTIGNTLQLRRQSHRKRRQHKLSVNPIVNSPQYQAYRQRQTRDGNSKDQKWPELLEDAFLEGR